MGFYGPGEAAGFLMSFVGAVLLLVLYRMMVRRRAAASVSQAFGVSISARQQNAHALQQ